MTQESKNNAVSDNDKQFTVSDRVEIIRILRGLAREMHPLSAMFDVGDGILLTAVLDVDPKENVVYLDTNANQSNNNLLLASRKTNFVSNADGVKVQWVSTEIGMGEFESRRAFRVPIPETLQRVQRRGLYRINTPLINPVMCKIPVAENHIVEVALVDICGEGLGVVLPDDPPVPEIKKGAQFANCTIDFPEVGVVQVTLFVQSVWAVTLKNGLISHRAGLGFVDIRSGTQSRVQRYINMLQRNRIAGSAKR